MLPDRVSNPGPLTYESGALPIALDKHMLTNNKIADDMPSKQLFPKQVATQLPLLN